METFSILGTGWLGLALAKELKGDFKVKVSIRNKAKEKDIINEGFSSYLLDEQNLQNLDFLLDCDYLFINFPPSKFDDYIQFLKNIYENENIKKCKKIIFISSTSIYPNKEGTFSEDIEITEPKSKLVFSAENFVKDKTDVIFRCSGLMGYNRIAGRYFSGKVLDSEDMKINYVHRDDIIKATKFVIEKNLSGIYNLCSKIHPSKKEIYLNNALKYGFEPPIFKDKKEYKERLIDGSKIESKGFKYDYPNPLEY